MKTEPQKQHAWLQKLVGEWTYEGESPQQLALAILYDFTGDKIRSIGMSEAFMKKVIANLDNDWELKGEDVADAIAEIERV